MAGEPLVLMQVVSVIDERTTTICLHAAGMIEEAEPVEGMIDEMAGPATVAPVTYPSTMTLPTRAEVGTWDDITDAARRNRETYRTFGPTEERVADFVEGWTGGKNRIEQLRAEIAAGQWDDVVGAIRNGPQSSGPIYRGLHISDEEMFQFAMSAKPGDSFDLMGVSSFTEKLSHAERFMGFDEGIVLELVDQRGLSVAAISNTPSEAEWLVAGKVRITEIVSRKVSDVEDYETVRLHVRGVLED